MRTIGLAGLLTATAVTLVATACGSRSELFESDFGEDAGSREVDSGAADVREADAPDATDATDSADADMDAGPECTKPEAFVLLRSGELLQFDPKTAEMTPLGTPDCNATGNPYTLSVTRDRTAFILYEDWNIYQVDLHDLHCSKTSFDQTAFGFTGLEGIAVSRSTPTETLYVYGPYSGGGVRLVAADVDTLSFALVGPVEPDPHAYPIDMQSNQAGTLYGITDVGRFVEIRESDATLVSVTQAQFQAPDDWALMVYESETFLFGTTGVVTNFYRYDVASNDLSTVATFTSQGVVGASAVPCP
jgi:hypothetical protein